MSRISRIAIKARNARMREIRRRELFFLLLLAMTVVLSGILTLLAKQNPYFSVDLALTRAIQQFGPLWFEILMYWITVLGNALPGIFLVIVTGLIFLYKKRGRDAFFLISSALGAVLISDIVKLLVARPRPSPTLIVEVAQNLHTYSFPSGHVLFFVGFFGFLLFLTYSFLRKSLVKKLLLLLFSSLILLVGLSRIYLGAHWFSDVIGAYLFGFLWLTVIIVLYNKQWLLPYGKKEHA